MATAYDNWLTDAPCADDAIDLIYARMIGDREVVREVILDTRLKYPKAKGEEFSGHFRYEIGEMAIAEYERRVAQKGSEL